MFVVHWDTGIRKTVRWIGMTGDCLQVSGGIGGSRIRGTVLTVPLIRIMTDLRVRITAPVLWGTTICCNNMILPIFPTPKTLTTTMHIWRALSVWKIFQLPIAEARGWNMKGTQHVFQCFSLRKARLSDMVVVE